MRFNDPVDTLAYHTQGRPLTNAVDISSLKVVDFAKAAREFLSKHGKTTPESDALFLYAGNHALANIRQRYALHEPMLEQDLDLVRKYFRYGNEAFQRMLFYCVVICFREARHLHNKDAMKAKLTEAGLGAANSFVTAISDDETKAMNQMMAHKSKLELGIAMKALSFVFHKGSWGHQFGGKKWGVIADAVVKVVYGEITPEVFTDIGYALAHNGGPIFNKGMFYKHYSQDLIKLLDVQRAGQIPAYINQGASVVIHPEHKAFVSLMYHLGDDFTQQAIDEDKVKALGAIGKWAKKHEPVGTFTPTPVPTIKGFVKYVTYWPGKTVAKITREGLAA